jgi:hypothetical protein
MTIRRKLLLLGALLTFSMTGLSQCLSANGSPVDGKPGLALSLRAVQDTAKSGNPVFVSIVLTNKSDQDMSIWGENGPDAGGSYGIDVYDARNTLAPDTKLGRYKNGHVDLAKLPVEQLEPKYMNGSGGCFTLKAGTSLSQGKINVSRYYDLSVPREYTIQLRKYDPVLHKNAKSNVVKVTVVP